MQPESLQSLIDYRRRVFFYRCNELGIDEIQQRKIADSIIPDNYPGKFTDNGEVSRKPIFTNARFANRAVKHLEGIRQYRSKSHRRTDGTKSRKVSKRQFEYVLNLGRKLGWNEHGEEDMKVRIGKFASSRVFNDSPQTIRMLEAMSSKQMSDLIRGMKALVNYYC